MGVEVEVFHMLIERLSYVEDDTRKMRDEVQKMRDDLGCIFLPRLEDVTADNVQQLKNKLKEQDVVRALSGRSNDKTTYVMLHGELPRDMVRKLKDNGFRVKVAEAGRHRPGQEAMTMILWADAVCDRKTLAHVWVNPEQFKDL